MAVGTGVRCLVQHALARPILFAGNRDQRKVGLRVREGRDEHQLPAAGETGAAQQGIRGLVGPVEIDAGQTDAGLGQPLFRGVDPGRPQPGDGRGIGAVDDCRCRRARMRRHPGQSRAGQWPDLRRHFEIMTLGGEGAGERRCGAAAGGGQDSHALSTPSKRRKARCEGSTQART